MDYDYSQRNYLLPQGYKDLIDVIKPKTSVTKWGFVIITGLTEDQGEDAKILIENNTLHVIANKRVTHVVEVPSDYATTKARAIYGQEQLRIVIPKATA
jgi:hypothetical protein